jgi:hypothetical protein
MQDYIGVDGHLFIRDAGNYAVREMTTDGTVTTITGRAGKGFTDGDAYVAMLNELPFDIAADARGNLYISDFSNNRILRNNADGTPVVSYT